MNLFDPNAKKAARIAQAKAEAAAKAASKNAKPDAIATRTTLIKPEEATERIRIVFDNSSSMNDHVGGDYNKSRISEARKGIVEYLRNCQLNRDAVAIHFLNNYASYRYEDAPNRLLPLLEKSQLTTDLLLLASAIDSPNIAAIGGTPLFEVTEQALAATPEATRLIIFSDGEPNNELKKEFCINEALRKKVPIDTVFIGNKDDIGAALLQEIAERTHGIYIVIDSTKGADFSTAFKYLAPTMRFMLVDDTFKARLERGEVK